MAKSRFSYALRAGTTALLLSGAGQALAGVPLIYRDGGTSVFRFEVPDSWTARVGFEVTPASMPAGATPAPRIISLMPEDGADRMWTGLWSPPGVVGIEGGAAYAKTLDTKLLDKATIETTRDVDLPGGKARIWGGSGTRLGQKVVFNVAVIALPGDRVVVGAFVGAPELRANLDTELQAILASIASEGGR